jgi:glycosyltransferase involved in cell wall biosynthesis
MKKVSIIICTYNEERTIENVIKKCYEYNPKSEIIVVDDGSKDNTKEILKNLKKEISFKYICVSENKGKSNAMVLGVENAKNEVILFFDADISGIRKIHFQKLLDPILDENTETDMVLGVPSKTLIDYRINPFKSLTGERALLKKDIEPILENIRNIRFGVETYINLHFLAHGKKIKYTLLEGLKHPTKFHKTSTSKAIKEFLSEGQEIAITLINNHDLITKIINNSLTSKAKRLRVLLKSFRMI